MRPLERNEKRPDLIVGALNDLAAGRQLNGGILTLAAGAASTTVSRMGVAQGDHITLTATTANAAAEFKNGTIYIPVATVVKNQFLIVHANNAQTDRTYTFSFVAVQTARAH